MSYARCIVANKSNVTIAEIEPDIEYISWILNGVGKASFSLSRADSKATEEILQYGNRLLFEFDNGLPNWGGLIDPPRGWESGLIKCRGFTAEQIFKFRQTDKGRYFSGDTVGAIFKKVIKEANDISETGVSIGDVWEGGGGHSPEYHLHDLLDIFQSSLTGALSSADFDITATLASGKIIFKANLYERKGKDKPDIAFVEGQNVTEIKLMEQGDIINSVDVAAGGLGWGDTRLTGHAEDAASIDKYGLREWSRVYPGVVLQSTIDAHAVNTIDETKDPYNEFSIDVLDESPGAFADYHIGDAVNLVSSSFGFGGTDTMVKIIEREYTPSRGICLLTLREVT